MSLFDGQRLPHDVFQIDVDRLRRGWYTDAYFSNIVRILEQLSAEGYQQHNNDVGNLHVEMQVFTRRKPLSVIAGADEALAILQTCCGYYQGNDFVTTYCDLDSVEAVQDGSICEYDGDVEHVLPVLRIRGRYRDFALLETPILGVLAEHTRVATNVFEVLQAAGGKDVMFFPARFAHYKLQAIHGYAYRLAVQAYNRKYGARSRLFISTDDQGAWWGGRGGGTMSHSLIACFAGDTPEAMLQFARVMPVDVPRVALVDFHNDCIGTTLAVMAHLWAAYRQTWENEGEVAAAHYRLFGVRPDTSGNMRDAGIEPLGSPELDCGVTPRLIWGLRNAINAAWASWSLPPTWEERAKEWCRSIRIVATGGFDPTRIRRFEQLRVPVDIYGVGSWLLSKCADCGTSNDFTADVVRVKHHGTWVPMAKVGRKASSNPLLETVWPQ